MTGILSGILIVNFLMTIKTPFSGTTYLQLPSNFYVTDEIEGELFRKSDYEIQTDDLEKRNLSKRIENLIPPGSFILAVNDNNFDLKKFKDSISGINYVKNLLGNASDYAYIKVLIPNSYPTVEETSGAESFRKYSREYKVKKDILLKRSLSSDKIQDLKNIKYIKDGIFLGFLAKGGATDRAGIQSGDILLSVDNIKWEVEFQPGEKGYFLTYKSLYKLRTQPKGVPLNYKILRENQIIEKQVVLATFGIPISLLIYFISGFLFITVGWVYAYNHPQYLGSRLTGLWLILMGFVFGSQMQMLPIEYRIYSLIYVALKESAALISLPIILHSFSYFPSEHKSMTRKKWLHLSIYLIFIVQLILVFITIFAKIQLFNSAIFLWISLPVIGAYVAIKFLSGKSIDKTYKKVNYLMMSIFSLVIIFGNLPYLLNHQNPIVLQISWYGATILTTLIPIFYLIIAWKYRIYDITFKLRKSIQYNMLTFLWQMIMFGIGGFAVWSITKLDLSNLRLKVIGNNIEFFTQNEAIKQTTSFEKIIFLIIIALVLIVIYKFSFAVQKILNQKFYRQKFDYKMSQNELIKLIQTNFTLRDLAKIIVEKLGSLVHLKRVGTVFYQKAQSKKDSKPGAIYCYDSKIGNEFCNILNTDYYEMFSQLDSLVSIDRLPDQIKENLESNGIKYIIPIKSKKVLIGTIYIGEKLSETAMTKDDFDFMTSIISHISIAIENAFLYEELAEQERMRHELNIARNIQLASLPQSLPHISGLDVSGISIPAHEVGGDFYDFYNGNGNDLTVVVGDVSGKGTSAALYMSKVQGILRTLNEFNLNPKDLFVRTNRLLYKNIESNSFITAIGAHFNYEKREILLSRAGHLPLIKYSSKTRCIEHIVTPGIGLGLANEEVFDNSIDEKKYDFEKGDIFLFLSDGLTDARNMQMEEFGFDRLSEIILDNTDKTSKYLCDEIIREVKEYAGDSGQFDDITAVIVKVTE